MRTAVPLIFATLLGACQAVPPAGASASAAQDSAFAPDTAEWRGEKFARNRCSDCHAVERWKDSPNPAAPTFERIANTRGLTLDSLKQWLRDAHNYPEAMYFEIPAEHIDDLAAYVITLQRDDYEPPIS